MSDPANRIAMTADHAIRLVNAWQGKSGMTDIAKLLITPNGDFSYQGRGAIFHYEGQTKRLIVSGLVGQRMLQFTAAREPWDELQFYAAREQVTLGEGSFELVSTALLTFTPPVLLLRKSFFDGAISNQQFILETRWLLEWATHWRTRRLPEIYSTDPAETVARKGEEHVAFALRNRLRPW